MIKGVKSHPFATCKKKDKTMPTIHPRATYNSINFQFTLLQFRFNSAFTVLPRHNGGGNMGSAYPHLVQHSRLAWNLVWH
mmetsp:Transcript_4875/g.9079  ORF Transcript_4875/g.9079 Transcript_4875/m.9079 type:complete len:80 (+) Transcript_4875:214-453(+)